ncbi:MAG: Rrf2 family transcriptional regulator [Opitutales bacterium]
MELTAFTDYSLRLLIYLGREPEKLASIDMVAEYYGVSRHHIAKIVNRLSELGYIETIRGKNGGIKMKKTPEEINVGTLVLQTEPHFNIVECFDSKTNTCNLNNCCALKGILAQARNAFIKTLRAYTLADALAHPGLAEHFKKQLATA